MANPIQPEPPREALRLRNARRLFLLGVKPNSCYTVALTTFWWSSLPQASAAGQGNVLAWVNTTRGLRRLAWRMLSLAPPR